jgi:hypothetical protein
MPADLFITNTANANLDQRLRKLISTSRELRVTKLAKLGSPCGK